MEENTVATSKKNTGSAKEGVTKLSAKEKRLDQRRKIEELMENKRLRQYTENYDYYFCEKQPK